MKQHPKSVNEEDEGDVQEAGSFFNWFVDGEAENVVSDDGRGGDSD